MVVIPQNSLLIGERIHALAEQLYPICRSITGNGVRETLRLLQEEIPLQIFEVPSGTQVFDWTVPEEWNIRDAWVKNEQGEKIIDFKKHNLHLLNYSIPIHQKVTLKELKKHLYTLPQQPDLIPYKTSYYQKNWGFCCTHHLMESLEEGAYEVYIDSSLEKGSLTYGEFFIPGESKEEIVFTAHICHPSLANDNLAGIGVITELAKYLSGKSNKYSYRFIFIPGTIGSITWLAQNQDKIPNIKCGIVASLLGDSGAFAYKKSRQGNAEIDFLVEYVLKNSGYDFQTLDFIPYGYDERQFCSPAFNLAFGNLTRSQFGAYPEYHTSGDNLDLVQPQFLAESFDVYRSLVDVFEENEYYVNLQPHCEPQLGKRGLYDAIGGDSNSKASQMAMLWVLNYSDGKHSLLEIAERSGYNLTVIERVVEILVGKGLLEKMA
ncbi:MAG: DUF4910 domain-containing protein [Bacteroidota bacterium]